MVAGYFSCLSDGDKARHRTHYPRGCNFQANPRLWFSRKCWVEDEALSGASSWLLVRLYRIGAYNLTMATKTQWEYCQVIWLTDQINKDDAEEFKKSAAILPAVPELQPQKGHAEKLDITLGLFKLCVKDAMPEPFSNLTTKIGELGLDGWELVSHSKDPIDRSQVFYFKRPK
jgi:hypothetical protein